MSSVVLTISCKDSKGIVATVSNFIYEHKGNIVSLDQFSDQITNSFFMRVEWLLAGFDLGRANISQEFASYTESRGFVLEFNLFFSDQRQRVAVFVSKYDHCLYDLLLRNRAGELLCDIPLVVSNHKELAPVAKAFGVDFKYIPVAKDNKLQQEQKALRLLQRYNIDFVVLARYMQILSKDFVAQYPHKIINIHHSFLPAFKGARPYHQAYEKGVKVIGATSHFVTQKLDQGPIIEQDVVQISHKDQLEDLIAKGRDLERVVLSRAVRYYLEHRLFVSDNRTIIF